MEEMTTQNYECEYIYTNTLAPGAGMVYFIYILNINLFSILIYIPGNWYILRNIKSICSTEINYCKINTVAVRCEFVGPSGRRGRACCSRRCRRLRLVRPAGLLQRGAAEQHRCHRGRRVCGRSQGRGLHVCTSLCL